MESATNHIKKVHAKVQWKLVLINENGKINCFDCKETFCDVSSVKKHYKKAHMAQKKFVCKECNKSFEFEDYVKLHIKAAHMLPKKAGMNISLI